MTWPSRLKDGSSNERGAAREAICAAAGWKYCAEHDKPRYDGPTPCAPLHYPPDPEHDAYCTWPDTDCRCGTAPHIDCFPFSGASPSGGES